MTQPDHRFIVFDLLSHILKTTVYITTVESTTMARECNIDARGKFVRLLGGTFSLAFGLVLATLLLLGILTTNWLTISSVIGLFFGGALGIYEGRSGWCVARAMGIWTPI